MESDGFDFNAFKIKKAHEALMLHAYYTRRFRESGRRWSNHRRDQMREQAKHYAFWRGWKVV